MSSVRHPVVGEYYLRNGAVWEIRYINKVDDAYIVRDVVTRETFSLQRKVLHKSLDANRAWWTKVPKDIAIATGGKSIRKTGRDHGLLFNMDKAGRDSYLHDRAIKIVKGKTSMRYELPHGIVVMTWKNGSRTDIGVRNGRVYLPWTQAECPKGVRLYTSKNHPQNRPFLTVTVRAKEVRSASLATEYVKSIIDKNLEVLGAEVAE